MTSSPRVLLWASLGVLGFSFTLPATRLAVPHLGGTFVGLGRALTAALLAAGWLAARRAPLPPKDAWMGLSCVASGVVLGFPWLSALALREVPAVHGIVMVGLAPLLTAVMAVLRAGERPSPPFWAASGAGALLVLAYGMLRGGGQLHPADGLLLLAVLAVSFGYAEGAILARRLGGMQVIAWALLIASPVAAIAVACTWDSARLASASPSAWLGFAYVSLVSMFLAFIPWYRALASGAIARVGQVQLAQPMLGLIWTWALLKEAWDPLALLTLSLVLVAAVGAWRARIALRLLEGEA